MPANLIKLSVILAVRNESGAIEKCIDSICGQLFDQTFEVILIDGLSDDGTLEIARDALIKNKVENYKILINHAKHVAQGLNMGINEAQGEFLCRIDGRFELSSNYFQSCYDFIVNKDCDIIGGKLINRYNNFLSKILADVLSSKFGVGWGNFRTLSNDNSSLIEVDTVTGVFGETRYFKNFFYDEYFIRSQDEDLNFRFRMGGLKICLNTQASIFYEIRSTFKSIIHQYFQYGYWKFKVSLKHKQIIVLRQLIPVFFLGYIFILPFLLFKSLFFLLPLFLYLIIPLFVGCRKFYFYKLAMLFSIHISYGLGGVYSILGFKTPHIVQSLTR